MRTRTRTRLNAYAHSTFHYIKNIIKRQCWCIVQGFRWICGYFWHGGNQGYTEGNWLWMSWSNLAWDQSKVWAWLLNFVQNNLVKSEYCPQFWPALTFDRDLYNTYVNWNFAFTRSQIAKLWCSHTGEVLNEPHNVTQPLNLASDAYETRYAE